MPNESPDLPSAPLATAGRARSRSSKPPPEWTPAEERAKDLVLHHRLEGPDAIVVERIACAERAYVSWGETGGADARVVRGANHARITVAAWQRGTPRGRWSMTHELAHWLLHKDVDAGALDRIHGGAGVAIDGREYKYEREADRFTAELLMPRGWFAPRCGAERPTVDDLDLLAAEYGTSLTATAKRYARFATAPCALVECEGPIVKRALRSSAWRGIALGGRPLEAGSFAAALARGESIAAGPRPVERAWGRERLGVEMTEHAMAIPESNTIIVWLWHAHARAL